MTERGRIIEFRIIFDCNQDFDIQPVAQWLLSDLIKLVHTFPDGHPLKVNFNSKRIPPSVFASIMEEH